MVAAVANKGHQTPDAGVDHDVVATLGTVFSRFSTGGSVSELPVTGTTPADRYVLHTA
jgi:hypothetical protein